MIDETISKIEANKLDIVKKWVSLPAILSDMKSILEMKAKATGVPGAVLLDIAPLHRVARDRLDQRERLEDRRAVRAPAAEVVHGS